MNSYFDPATPKKVVRKMLWAKGKIQPRLKAKVGVAIACSSLFIWGCESNKLAQCEAIFAIARDVSQNSQNLQAAEQQSLEPKIWLQAANQFRQAAERLRGLEIESRELMQYQNRLAHIYRLYAQTTDDAVRARENKNLPALESARNDVIKAGALQRQLVQELNAYCLKLE